MNMRVKQLTGIGLFYIEEAILGILLSIEIIIIA